MESLDRGLRRVARIGKPHGIRGEVTVQIFTDSPETRFSHGSILVVRPGDGSSTSYKELTVDGARWNKKILLLKFAEFSDRNSAELLRDSELYTLADDNSVDKDEWYPGDLIGFSVHQDSAGSRKIGSVTDLITGGAQDLLKVTLSDGREILIPFVSEIVPEIIEDRGVVVITPPPGLLELNQD